MAYWMVDMRDEKLVASMETRSAAPKAGEMAIQSVVTRDQRMVE